VIAPVWFDSHCHLQPEHGRGGPSADAQPPGVELFPCDLANVLVFEPIGGKTHIVGTRPVAMDQDALHNGGHLADAIRWWRTIFDGGV